jgi:hypothetical protein
VDALETERKTRVLQLEHIVIQQRILLEPRQFVEKSHAADAFTEEPAQHAILRPDVTVVCRDVLDDIVSRGADEVFGRVGVGFGNAT